MFNLSLLVNNLIWDERTVLRRTVVHFDISVGPKLFHLLLFDTAISKDVCIQETFRASCLHVPGTVISIQSALYGRMRSSRCTYFDSRELNCQANVQPYLESLCNKRTECTIKAANDTLKEAIAYCQRSLKPFLEVVYTCVYGKQLNTG